MQDIPYKSFAASLMPTVSKETVIGIRTPQLKKYAKEICGTTQAKTFIKELPHKYFEENNLHAFLICAEKDFEKQVELIDEFLPFVNNWATCDSMRPASFAKNKAALLPHIDRWLKNSHPYTVRFAVLMLMVYYLDQDFNAAFLEKVAAVKSEEYYVNMMLAWYFATALAKQWESTLPILLEKRLSVWVHNKAIQKAKESFRINQNQKNFLKALKR